MINSVKWFFEIDKYTKGKMIFFKAIINLINQLYYCMLSRVFLYSISFIFKYLKSRLYVILSSILEKHGNTDIVL